MTSPTNSTVKAPGQVATTVTEVISGAGTRLSHEMAAAIEQVISGGRQRLLVTVLLKVEIAPAVESALPLRVLAECKIIAPSTTTVPTKVALSPNVN